MSIFCAARFQMTHGLVPVQGPGIGDCCYMGWKPSKRQSFCLKQKTAGDEGVHLYPLSPSLPHSPARQHLSDFSARDVARRDSLSVTVEVAKSHPMEVIVFSPSFFISYFAYLPAGFQRADHSPCRHHSPHRFLLAGELHPGGHFDHASARCLRLPNGGMKTEEHTLAYSHANIDIAHIWNPVKHSLFLYSVS